MIIVTANNKMLTTVWAVVVFILYYSENAKCETRCPTCFSHKLRSQIVN